MKLLSTKIHGVIDYLAAFALLIIPYSLHYDISTMPGGIFIILGVSTIIYSIITKYEYGILNILPMKVHLALDILSGILLASSPWLFGFKDEVFLPHLIFGLFEIVAGLITTSKTSVKL